jgi:hypothetical protein
MNFKKVKKTVIAGLLFFYSINDVAAQNVQKIGEESFNIDVNAALEVQHSTKGFLPPRMTADQTNVLRDLLLARINNSEASAGEGMIIFSTTDVTDTNGKVSTPGLRVWSLTGLKTLDATGATPTMTVSPGWSLLEDSNNKSSYVSLTANGESVDAQTYDSSSDLLYPTQKAVKTYVDEAITAIVDNKFVTNIRKLNASTNNTVGPTDYTLLCNSTGGLTLTLPTIDDSTKGRVIVIRKTDPGTDNLDFDGGTIQYNGQDVSSLNYQKTIRIQSDTSNWVVID